jgi:plasmid stability protein
MSKMIQVRDVPDHVHGTLKSRAASEGMSLSDFLKKELARAAERPTMQEWLDRAQQTKPIRAKLTPAQAIREMRDSR